MRGRAQCGQLATRWQFLLLENMPQGGAAWLCGGWGGHSEVAVARSTWGGGRPGSWSQQGLQRDLLMPVLGGLCQGPAKPSLPDGSFPGGPSRWGPQSHVHPRGSSPKPLVSTRSLPLPALTSPPGLWALPLDARYSHLGHFSIHTRYKTRSLKSHPLGRRVLCLSSRPQRPGCHQGLSAHLTPQGRLSPEGEPCAVLSVPGLASFLPASS